MSKKQRVIRGIVSGTLLAAVALVAVSIYRVETSRIDQLDTPQEENQTAEVPEKNDTEENHATVITGEEEEVPEETLEEIPEETPKAEDASSTDVSAQVNENAQTDENASDETKSTSGDVAGQTEAAVLPALDFTEDSLMEWPVSGSVLMDYSMDHTVYFPTLNQYKYNPAILVSATAGDPVYAASNAKIMSIEENTQTGTTVTVDLGNGYQAIYGQLKDVQVQAEDVVAKGAVLGYINEPSRFYATEGTNLYFSMSKDGESIDPIMYLP